MATRYEAKNNKPKIKGMLLYLLALPLLPAALISLTKGDVSEALSSGLGFALMMVGARLLRQGIMIEVEALKRKIVRRSSTLPYKFFGGCLIAFATALVSLFSVGNELIASILYGVTAFGGFYLCYGFDPARNNPEISGIGITSEEVIELLDGAEKKIEAIEKSKNEIKNLELNDRLRGIIVGVRQILTMIEEDPRDARRARKFLKVYLDGVTQVTEGYAKTHKYEDSPQLEENFRRVLATMETVIDEQQKKLLENNLSELDVNMEVLQMQLKKEGVI